MPTVRTDDAVELAYTVQGLGPTTILFMHGWAGSGTYFDEVISELDLSGVRVVTMDFRGHGSSEDGDGACDLDRIAGDVWTVADAAGATDIVVAGFSMSGKFAQYVASCRPDRVSGLVLIGGLPATEIPFPQDVIRDWVGRAGNRERFRQLSVPFISEPVAADVLNRFLDNAVRVPAAALESTLETCVRTSFADRLGSLRMPALVVGGRHDPIFTPEAVSYVARSLPCARGVYLECNHEIPMERPRELAQAIEAFVCGLGAGCQTKAESIAGMQAGVEAMR